MELKDVEDKLKAADRQLDREPFVLMHSFERSGRPLHLVLSERLRRLLTRGRLWKSKNLLVTLKNAEYGFSRDQVRSRAGQNGIFLVDRHHRPENEMMKRLFGGFLDKPRSGAQEVAEYLGTDKRTLELSLIRRSA